jgi:hypothetical protein
MPPETEPSLPHLELSEDNEQLSDFLLAGQRYLMKHPQASRELIAGLIEDGRRFAQTEEGKAWADALANSELVKRAMLIWEAYGLDLLMETRPAITPSTWLDMIVAAIANPDLESVLSMLIVEEMRHGNIAAP